MVPRAGIEPAWEFKFPWDFKSHVSTNSTISAKKKNVYVKSLPIPTARRISSRRGLVSAGDKPRTTISAKKEQLCLYQMSNNSREQTEKAAEAAFSVSHLIYGLFLFTQTTFFLNTLFILHIATNIQLNFFTLFQKTIQHFVKRTRVHR